MVRMRWVSVLLGSVSTDSRRIEKREPSRNIHLHVVAVTKSVRYNESDRVEFNMESENLIECHLESSEINRAAERLRRQDDVLRNELNDYWKVDKEA